MFDAAWEWLVQFFKDNQFASGGILLGMIGGLTVALRSVPGKLFRFARQRVLVEIEILDNDEAFVWLSRWLARHRPPTKGRTLQAITQWHHRGSSGGDAVRLGSDCPSEPEKLPPLHLVPGVGVHLIWHRRCPILVHHSRNEGTPGKAEGSIMDLLRPESFVLRGLSAYRKAMIDLLEQCRQEAMPPPEALQLFVAEYSRWDRLCEVRGRPLDSVIVADEVTERLIADIELFRSRGDWYAERGIPWRRGYLLSGPPGNGKTSLIRAVATHFGFHIGTLNLSCDGVTDSRLLQLFAQARSNMVIVVEDIDCIYEKREAKEASEKISFSGLLNAIDGLTGSQGRLLFMTTNHPDKLDAALLRSGRVDVRLCLGAPTEDQAKRLFRLFHPNGDGVADRFAAILRERDLSMADLQEQLIKHADQPARAAAWKEKG